MDHWFPIILLDATILVTQFIPCSTWIALESGFQDWIDRNSNERGIRKKMIIPKNNLKLKFIFISLLFKKIQINELK